MVSNHSGIRFKQSIFLKYKFGQSPQLQWSYGNDSPSWRQLRRWEQIVIYRWVYGNLDPVGTTRYLSVESDMSSVTFEPQTKAQGCYLQDLFIHE